MFKHIARKIIRWTQRRTPRAIWSSWTMDEISAFAPDKNDLLSALPPNKSSEELQSIFGVDAFMLSCWACLFHGVQEKNRPAFEKASAHSKMQQLLQAIIKKHGHDPNLNTLGEGYVRLHME